MGKMLHGRREGGRGKDLYSFCVDSFYTCGTFVQLDKSSLGIALGQPF